MNKVLPLSFLLSRTFHVRKITTLILLDFLNDLKGKFLQTWVILDFKEFSLTM